MEIIYELSEEQKNHEVQEKERTFAVDKIFNNKWNKVDIINDSEISFKVDYNYYDYSDQIDTMTAEWLRRDIHECIANSEEYSKYVKNLSKIKIPEIYSNIFSYVYEKIGRNYEILDIFTELAYYFDVTPHKWLEKLTIKYKDLIYLKLNAKNNRKNVSLF